MASSTRRPTGNPSRDASYEGASPETMNATPGSEDRGGTEDMKQRVKDDAREALNTAREHAQTGIQQAAQQADNLAEAASQFASSLSEKDMQGLASYAQRLSTSLSSFADRLQHGNVEELVGEARNLARNNPTMFLVGSVALGFGLSRFLKASDPDNDGGQYDDSRGSFGGGRMGGDPTDVAASGRGAVVGAGAGAGVGASPTNRSSDTGLGNTGGANTTAGVEDDLGKPGSNREFTAPPDEVAPSTIVYESVQYTERPTDHE